MKTAHIVLLIPLTLLSCTKNNGINDVVVESYIDLSINDNQGQDLLDSKTINYFDAGKIEILYQTNEGVKLAFDSTKDYPKFFSIFKEGLNNTIRIFLNLNSKEQFSTTYIKWDERDVDTLRTEFEKVRSNVKMKRVWINGKLGWPNNQTKACHINIKKNIN